MHMTFVNISQVIFRAVLEKFHSSTVQYASRTHPFTTSEGHNGNKAPQDTESVRTIQCYPSAVTRVVGKTELRLCR